MRLRRWSAQAVAVVACAGLVLGCSSSLDDTSTRSQETEATSNLEPDRNTLTPPSELGGLEMPRPSPSPDGLPSSGAEEGEGLSFRPGSTDAGGEKRLVEGFPHALRPVGRSDVVASSLSPAGQRTQVTLEATTQRSPRHVLRTYRSRLDRPGLKEVPTTAVPGSSAVAFRGGGTALVVTVRSEARGTTYTVYGVIHDAGA